jgi:hypothetical protein
MSRKGHQEIMNPSGEWDVYQIKIAGTLDPSWSEWLGGMEIRSESSSQTGPVTILTGSISDQAILRGILCKIWDLNFKVISVCQTGSADEELDQRGIMK